MVNKYKRKYKIQKLVKQLIDLENLGEKKIDIEDLLDLIGFDVVDIYFFYINKIKGRFRFNKDYKDTK